MTGTIMIEDSTLREGEQTPGVAFSETQKVRIVEALVEAGIRYIEVGTAVMGANEERALRALVERRFDATLIGWNRGLVEDVDRTLDTGLTAIHIGLPSSKVHIEDKFHRSENWVLDCAQSLVEHAKKRGATFISVSAEDMGRADPDFLHRYAKLLRAAGATRMRLSDTIGCLTPQRVASVVSGIKSKVDIDLQLHMHNDFNLALANVMAGIEAGANQVHVTVNGLGERAGLAAMHQVIAALEILMGRSTGVRTERLSALSDLVASFTRLPLAHNEPILGEHVFTHESGIHVDGMLKLKESFEAFPPERFGRQHQFVIGKHSGTHGLTHILAAHGLKLDSAEAKALLPVIRDLSLQLGGAVPPSVALLVASAMRQARKT